MLFANRAARYLEKNQGTLLCLLDQNFLMGDPVFTPIHHWKTALNRFMIEFEDRLIDYV